MKYTYTIENLDCAHCAQKIEQKIAETEDFENVSLNFATKSLNFESEKENPLPEIQQICDDLEEGVVVYDKAKKPNDEDKSRKIEKVLLAVGIVLGITALIIELFIDAPFAD